MMIRYHIVLAMLILTACMSKSAIAVDTWTDIIPGVRHLHRVTSDPQDIHIVLIDLKNPRVRLRSVIKNDSMKSDAGEIIRSEAVRYGAVVAINTDFCCTIGCDRDAHCPQGQCVTDGLVMFPISRTKPIFAGRSSLLISADGTVSVGVTTTPEKYYNIVAGGPRVIRDGVVGYEHEPGLPDQTVRHPRTGAAVTQDGKTLILAVVDGRQSSSLGMTANEMGTLLKGFGGYQGMSFDSGGSTTMVINGATVNHPSDTTGDRLVAGGLIVMDRFSQGSNPMLSYETGFEAPLYQVRPNTRADGWTGSIAIGTGGRVGQCATFSNTGAYRNIPDAKLSSVQWFECYIISSAANEDCRICVGTLNMTGVAALVKLSSSGSIQALDGDGNGGGTWTTIQSYSPNTYYRIGLRLDYYIGSYQVYVDGVLKVSGLAFQNNAALGGLGAIRFEQVGGTSMFCVDNLYVGNVDPGFPRVSPDKADVIVGERAQFKMMGGTAPSAWRITDEKNLAGQPVASGRVATIDSSGLVTAVSPGSCTVSLMDSIGRVDRSSRICISEHTFHTRTIDPQ